jgi:hypothetical protein
VFIWSDVTDTTLGDFLYITDVQLEPGAVATPFERRSYGQELALCQRYYEVSANFNLFSGYAVSSQDFYHSTRYCVTKRAQPTVTTTRGGEASFPAVNPAVQVSTTDGFYVSATANATATGYFQYAWTSAIEL